MFQFVSWITHAFLTYYNLLIMIRGKLIYKLTLFLFTSFSNCIYNSNLYNLCENVVDVGNKSFFFFSSSLHV